MDSNFVPCAVLEMQKLALKRGCSLMFMTMGTSMLPTIRAGDTIFVSSCCLE